MRNTTLLAACAVGIVLSACGGAPAPGNSQSPAAATASVDRDHAAADRAAPDQHAQHQAGAAADAAGSAGFAMGDVPVSEVALGEFPYLQLPNGYAHYTREGSGHDRVAFWTGDRLEWVEGRVFGSAVRADGGGARFALLEFQRNIRAAIEQAGGQRIAEGRIPRELRNEMTEADPDLGVRYNAGLGDIYNRPVETFVVRRPDREIWIQVTGNESGGNLLIAETRPVQITAGLLPAEALKQQLQADGRVAIEVKFAVDRADILPESTPQVDQVLALLQADPALRLSIEGHTDGTGDAAHNQRLSEARAGAVVAALVDKGIDGARLQSKGHGQSQPIADNRTEAGRASNRRVELLRLG